MVGVVQESAVVVVVAASGVSHAHASLAGARDREWLVLYCGASTSLGDTLKKYCHARGIKYKTEFFGSW